MAAAFTGCTEDFKNWASPQSNSPEDAISIPGFTASAVAAQNLATEADEVSLFSLGNAALPDGYTLGNARIELTPQGIDDANTTILSTTLTGLASVEALQTLVVETYGKRPTERTFDGHVKVNAIKDGQAVYIDAGTIPVKLIPEAPYIAQNYYVVGGTKDWAGSAASKEQKFSHSDADVYDDPVFTIIIDGTPDGDTWFAIGDDAGCDAITNDNDWSKLLGIVGGDSKATEGSLDYRYNLGADNSFCVSNARRIKITIDMMEYKFTVTPVNIADNYYLIGGPGEWNNSKDQKFSHSDKDVFDDPVFTYTFASTGGDMWFAFGDDEAIDAVGEGTWNKLFGTTGASEDLSGSFDRRYNLDGDHSFHVDGQASFYRFSVNMAEMTYEITPINLAAQYYVVGGVQGWSDKDKTCLFTPEEQKNVLSYTTKWTGAWDLKIWDADNFGNWDAAWGCTVDGDNSPSGALINSGAQAISAPSAEFYTFTIDMNTMTYTWTKLDNQAPTEYEFISLIGEFNGWGGDFDLTQVTPHNWYGVFTQEADGQLKYRANHDWAMNWGYGGDKDWNVADGFNKIGTNGGGNIWVPAGTYAVYLNDITNSMMIIAQ